jgi:ubiquinone/menaquinone biosynthesis C-methylase UbiE
VSRGASGVGRFAPTSSAALRPPAERELAAYGGERILRGRRVLDVGTGDGRLALGAARWARAVVGIDPDGEAVREARANARRRGVRNARFVVGSGQELPFRDASFDVVILSWAL